jgi:hypothetical protein
MELPEYPGYLIYRDGRIVKRLTNRELKHSQEKAGAYFVNVIKSNGSKSPIRISRLVAAAYLPKDDVEKTYVGFIDKNPANHAVENLRWTRKHEHLSAIATRELTETRKCKSCRETKNLDAFQKGGVYKGKLQYRWECCKCAGDKEREKRHTNKEYSEKVKKRSYEWRLRSAYKLTPDDKHQMFVDQNESCKICEKKFEKESDAHVDHIHDETQRVRGLLCPNCNRMLGMARDNPDILRKGAGYIELYAQLDVTVPTIPTE